ncbi:site-specific DNA-methyltransferase [Canibacter sp. lx-45]|uniref:site-specific DNA-methyltransferase n=1 Tax=Canibacter zhuwentaonis TaxID=2837491 RepID=UPI001BDD6A4C|nr:DNA methyltransferase [Canibacter zhuwentaonis]MBT1035460.1 site-specific DNA-methyltransferase [Canibacter zhuwentaonis]
MAAINDLINQVQDQELRARLQAEVNKLSKQKKFGLVYEEHMPECTALYDAPIRVGSKVALKDKQITTIYEVKGLSDSKVQCYDKVTQCEIELPLEDLICIAEFGEPIYPYLELVDSVCNAPDSSLWHTLIEADNYHALQLLEYLYAGQVDCIYIDPPYNTGARDWKYNNDYVDSSDAYRHSKWLSMMEKRLRLAKKLLNPKDSVLIVTIDEKEYLHLGCLLEELFPEAKMQMVSSVISVQGSVREGMFTRSNEYIYFVFIGEARAEKTSDDMLNPEASEKHKDHVWFQFIRTGKGALREDSPNLFYPFFINEDGSLNSVGDPLPINESIESVTAPEGTIAVWPITSKGLEGRWRTGIEVARNRAKSGFLRAGKSLRGRQYSMMTLNQGTIDAISKGELTICGYQNDGSAIIDTSHRSIKRTAKTVWNKTSHNAGWHGTKLLDAILLEGSFPYPKSIYAVHDAMRFFVENKPNALILDFFSGSGTTLHAVNLLNAEDGGQRRCIMVTNNEVSDEESKRLKKDGFKPGDPEWESLGIAQYVTWPRTVCSIEGHDVSGNPLKGNYLDSERSMADGFEANAAFFKLGFLDKNAVALGRQFKELLPVLWMKTGCVGTCPRLNSDELPSILVFPENGFAILLDELIFPEFIDKVNAEDAVEHIFIVTDSIGGFKEMASHLQAENVYQMYRDYLDNFRINIGR